MTISLEGISDQELVDRLKHLVVREQKFTHRVILHFAEIDRRRLYAELGFTSLYDYATRGLGYAAASAQRRIKAARAFLQVPEVYECLEDGRLSLRVLEVVADALSGENGRELIREVCGKSREEALRIVAWYFPVPATRLADRIEPIVVKKERLDDSQEELFNPAQNGRYFRAEVGSLVGNCEEQCRISFCAGAEFQNKLERVKELMFAAVGSTDLETIFERMLDDYLKRHCPKQRNRRREEKRERALKAQGEKIVETIDIVQSVATQVDNLLPVADRDPATSRYISASLRDQILERDAYCCTYVSKNGEPCASRSGLQIDHFIPFGLGGLTEADNLRTVCGTHNLMFARKIYGDAHIDAIIARRRPGVDGMPTVYVEPCRVCDPAERMLYSTG